VVIVGAGFGGLNAAKRLGAKPVDVLLIDQHNYHLFQPLLYQVATAGLEPGDIAYPVRRILHRFANVDFRLARVNRIDAGRHCVELDGGDEIAYDYLILAAGSDSNFFGMEQLAARAQTLKDVDGAVRARNHILRCFEAAVAESDPARRKSLLTFVAGGGGPTGVEFAGALSELVAVLLRHDYRTISAGEVQIYLVEGGPDLLSMLHPRLRRAALRELRRRGIQVRLNAQIKDYDGQTVQLSTGESIPAATLMWAAGVRAAGLAAASGVEQGRAGRLPVRPSLDLADHPEIFVAGDIAYLEERGEPLPQLAPVAIQQGRLAAENVLRRIEGRRLQPFRYRDRGTLATIGRHAAVGEIGPFRISGPLAWFMWLMVHLIQLIGFRNRLAVLLNWAWDYFRFDSAVRLITSQ